MLPYRVTQQYQHLHEETIAHFNTESDAQIFIHGRIEWNERLNTSDCIYRIYYQTKLIDDFQWSHHEEKRRYPNLIFNPTPQPTVFRPSRSTYPYSKQNDDEDDDE